VFALSSSGSQSISVSLEYYLCRLSATDGGGADPSKRAEVARNACQKAFEDVKDLAEIARKSQVEAMAGLTKRANEHAAEIKQLLERK
jgi:hypothetical protein